MAWERVHTDRINLELTGVFKDTNKTTAAAAMRVVEPEIRIMNKAKAVRDIMNGTSCLNDIATFIAFMERFRNSPTRFEPPSVAGQSGQQRQDTPVSSTKIARLKADDLKYDGTTQVTSYINRLEYIVGLYSEKQVLSLLPRAIKGVA
jgi:hypothetical protein